MKFSSVKIKEMANQEGHHVESDKMLKGSSSTVSKQISLPPTYEEAAANPVFVQVHSDMNKNGEN